jgi:hypothetical protein
MASVTGSGHRNASLAPTNPDSASSRAWLDPPRSAAAAARRLPSAAGAAALGLSALLPWSRRYPYSRRSGLDTARIILGLHDRIAVLPPRYVAWLWCAIPAAGAIAWAVSWLHPPLTRAALVGCGIVGAGLSGWVGLEVTRGRLRSFAPGVLVAELGACTVIVSASLLRRDRPDAPFPREVP